MRNFAGLVAATSFLLSCAGEKKPLPAGQVALSPLSRGEAQALRGAVRIGKIPGPGEGLAASPSCGDFVRRLSGFESGTIEVPEDWDQPSRPERVRVFYYFRIPKGEAAGRPPVVFFNGGPGSDSHSSGALLSGLGFSHHAPIVFLDQRGTGCSSPYPEEASEANAQRLARWGSRGIVGDAEAVRRKLFGDRKWRPFGQSFGGLIVHRYLEIAPDGIDRAVSHGASVMADAISWITERIRSQSRVAERYFARYPEDRAALQAARNAIPADRCWSQGTGSICGPAVLDSLTILLGFQSSWRSLHHWIRSLAPDGTVDGGALDQLVRTLVFGIYGQGGLGASVVSTMEIAGGHDDQEGCRLTLERLRAAGERPESFDINECRLLQAYRSPYQELLRKVPASPIRAARIAQRLSASGGSLKFFLFSGGQDVFTPLATFDEELRILGPLVHYRNFPDSGHEGFHTEEAVLEAVTGR